MNLNRCSKLAVALVVLLAVAAVPAAAVSISGDAPGSVQAGAQQETTFTVADPFESYEEWTLQAETDLTDVTWQIVTFDNAGNQIDEATITGQSVSYDFAASSGAVRAEVTIVGTVPSSNAWSWSYDPAQTITYAEFVQAQPGGASNTLETYSTRPYTTASQEARTAISDAEAAIQQAENAGASVGGAKSDLQDAIEFYNGGNFEQAVSNAEQAESAANSAASSAERTDLIIMIGAALVVLLLLAGGVYWYLQQRDSYDKLG
ncbi:hypothetical protein LPA44_02250 [Halobacterium sp. KA-4]|jgi:hypothetical protein|uniref:hypothetical protein n=1 Tax=Halobacterium sp. KA-4 TaxID=2896367 RepID=UPI001E3D9B92|nr:hypothetical protein [Halobacterium sp. KA-4]MCD2198722.1 hypothetical protein [Halobacterium sp. KA-4]